ncbi:hypothetical protein [Allomuricauda sp. ARW1Y1]|jgi:hypothetical protein|uniref:hypothetical protein n=1 Tax=Allomuricauda sp. ARW1Y1 TaxID=2663843 RepID=UPI0015CAFCCE|nr:hypothetical protein [Muricauda sp. ARW1Y1]NYJ26333.1 hypothetical protein [Muricauda sp. ARW1Y1]
MKFNEKSASVAGRKSSRKGIPNKATEEIRKNYLELVNGNMKTLEDDFKSLKPKERIELTIQLSKFVLPTLKAIDYQSQINGAIDLKPIVIDMSKWGK